MKSLFVLCLTLLILSPCHANNDALIIVLDASNSMWGKVNGEHKITIARRLLDQTLNAPNAPTTIGLVSYGDQHKADCNAIRTVAEPGSLTNSDLLKRANAIMPLGRSPISAALSQAATQGNTLLLFSDGEESCDADPCATVQTLKASNPSLRIHVVGFHDSDTSPLRCIAQNSGGNFTIATDETAVEQFLTNLNNTPTHPAETHPTGYATGTLQLSLGASNTPENLPASFLIYNEEGEHLTTFTNQTEVSHPLPPGIYQVDALWGEIKKNQSLTVQAGQTTQYHFDIGALGTLSLQAQTPEQQGIDANFSIYDDDGNYITSTLLKSHTTQKLPVGNYRIKVSAGNQEQTVNLTISPDEEVQHRFTFQPTDQ